MIITLCGSARFERLFKAWNRGLTMAGHTVFSLTAYPSDHGRKDWYSEEEKASLDGAHLRKIDASDAIFVINQYAYIGESTLREVQHAQQRGKAIYMLESWGKGLGICDMHTDACQSDVESLGLRLPTSSPIDTTTRSGFREPWSCDLLGPAGVVRGRIVEIVRGAEKSNPTTLASES